MKRLVLVDGNALLHRAYHATPPLSTSKGELVNAVYGFTAMLLKALNELQPDYLAVTWDMRAPTFRHEQFAGYKAQRKAADDALLGQYERVHQVIDALNIPEFKLSGFEADDLVGALAKQAEQKEKAMEIIILTGDRDLMQLINKRIKVLMPKKTINDVGLYGEEEFVLRFGFAPKNLIDYKGLAGDASDGIPGVPGIGEVTATKLIQEHQTVEKVYRHLNEFPQRLKKLLEEGKESAVTSKKLATIETQIPIKLDLLACRVHDFDKEKVKNLFAELEFRSLINRIPGTTDGHSGAKQSEAIESQNKDAIGRQGDLQHDRHKAVSTNTTDLDHQVEPVLKKMSETGVAVDLKFLAKMGKQLKERLEKIEEEIYATLGHQFNLNSPKQLSAVLFDELKLPVIKKTKTGRSTDEETLHELFDHHPAVPLILQYRQLFKLISTYVDALPKAVGEDKRIHSTFNVEGAATGRLSSQNPNLQNIPIKGEIGGEIRKAFIVPKGKVLLAADYSQIELRIMAHLAQDPGLLKAFQEEIDIHAATASMIFKVPVEEITKEQRRIGKTMNFATLYGQGPHALSRQLDVDYQTAREYIAEYFEQFPKVRDWMINLLEQAVKDGYVETIWGRRRYIPQLQMSNRSLRAFGERAAINMPVQGTAADMIKKAMVEIDKELSVTGKQKTDNCKLILQVHDELLFECGPKAVKETAKMVKEKMESALKLSVPVMVDLKVGPNWGEMKPLKIS
ncbi:MAG: polymerase I protein [Candidatus Daviesbacteria bacterium GW2011_GWA1_41_61]|uniref:DNA-directed DNA polymerase n=1 Tax=Candidatus Daviesbacteria bacterium GW2011_GWA2_40_9 TaxID=1618424 RepID=A0A0G0U8Y6_9BACT|nr:MAG: polymerase I protein [Candidatus Daviesbacteria bacterium GW2011_GWC1_40_9]KKR83701.1 MAG: polymerase I protein [Candidatus Daviesbacteria bacterium GW2011_GWA2_40_9]KKR93703.1 MAG: polymerase I protein [Candidatus Daviesbacteria bacterium GW2011_GWB1_41_15]KKS15169.1 MAG: polymerase I protein [Candidatus Daviesbacteria bacterium GW2011_GWA1_41_61]